MDKTLEIAPPAGVRRRRNLNVVSEARIRSVPCPRPECQAQPGEYCRDRSDVLRAVHAQRRRAWQWGGTHPERDVACPQCPARPGELCHAVAPGERRQSAHTGRYRRAGFVLQLAARQSPDPSEE